MKPEDLVDPHVLHLFLGHFPVVGLAFGLVALFISLLSRSNPMRVMALGLIIIASLSFWPTSQTGDASYQKAVEHSDSKGAVWLEEHANRGDRVKFYYYTLAAVAALAMLVKPTQSGLLMLMTTATVIGAVIMIAVGVWVGSAGIGASHEEIRGLLKRSGHSTVVASEADG